MHVWKESYHDFQCSNSFPKNLCPCNFGSSVDVIVFSPCLLALSYLRDLLRFLLNTNNGNLLEFHFPIKIKITAELIIVSGCESLPGMLKWWNIFDVMNYKIIKIQHRYPASFPRQTSFVVFLSVCFNNVFHSPCREKETKSFVYVIYLFFYLFNFSGRLQRYTSQLIV